jgi:hypothetical protein
VPEPAASSRHAAAGLYPHIWARFVLSEVATRMFEQRPNFGGASADAMARAYGLAASSGNRSALNRSTGPPSSQWFADRNSCFTAPSNQTR